MGIWRVPLASSGRWLGGGERLPLDASAAGLSPWQNYALQWERDGMWSRLSQACDARQGKPGAVAPISDLAAQAQRLRHGCPALVREAPPR